MIYYTIPPPEKLAGFVRCFWVLESRLPYTHRSMADICPEMVFHYNGQFDEMKADGRKEKSFVAGVQGQSRTYSQFRINKSFGIFGVYLYPYSIPLLFGMPAAELTGQAPDLDTLLGEEGRVLKEKVITAGSHAERVSILTSFLEKKLVATQNLPLQVFAAIQRIMQKRGIIRVPQVAEEFFLSERQFERKFKEFSGFNPKLFSRIVRFHTATNAYGDPSKTLTEIAYEAGYYDQSHFIHDFKAFSGYHPRHFFSGKAEGTEWRQ